MIVVSCVPYLDEHFYSFILYDNGIILLYNHILCIYSKKYDSFKKIYKLFKEISIVDSLIFETFIATSCIRIIRIIRRIRTIKINRRILKTSIFNSISKFISIFNIYQFKEYTNFRKKTFI